MRPRQGKRKNVDVPAFIATKNKKPRDKTYYPHKKYVNANILGKAEVITGLSIEEMQRGIAAGDFIPSDTFKQRRLVYELDGRRLAREDLESEKKRNKLLKNGKAVTATTYRNRKAALTRKSIDKITNYQEAWAAAIQLIPHLPLPEEVSHRYFQTSHDVACLLLRLPVTVMNKMGLHRSQRYSQSHDKYNIYFKDVNRYKKWRADNARLAADDDVGAEEIENEVEVYSFISTPLSPQAVRLSPATRPHSSTYLSSYGLFADSVHTGRPTQVRATQTVQDHLMPNVTPVFTPTFFIPSQSNFYPPSSPPCLDDLLSDASTPLDPLFDLERDWSPHFK